MNFKLLESVINEKGIKKSFVADKIGISRQSFYLKLNGEREFSQKEIAGLRDVLGLSDKQFLSIFFDDEVGKLPTEAPS